MVKGLDRLPPDPNPILDEGAPTSTRGIENANTLCEILGVPLILEPPRERYYQGWGVNCLGAKLVVCSWTLTLHDITGKPTSLTFDLVPGRCPLFPRQDVRSYCNTFNLCKQKYIRMKRPYDKHDRYLYTYVVLEDSRLRLDLALHPLSSKSTLLGNIHTTVKRAPLVFCKRVHRYTQATLTQMKPLCKEANMLDEELLTTIDEVFRAYEICTKNGRPTTSRKVSLTHVNQVFNVELQIDFFYQILRWERRTVMTITDTRRRLTELSITPDSKMTTIMNAIETVWICQHSAPEAISADDEYNRSPFRNYLSSHSITLQPRRARRNNKIGIVERKSGTVKAILSKVLDENSTAKVETLIARAAFLSNLFSGSKLLSSFEIIRGYSPSVVGLPKSFVTQELLDAHKEQAAIRSLQRLLHPAHRQLYRNSSSTPVIPSGYTTNIRSNSRLTNGLKETVVSPEDDYPIARRFARGQPICAAYEDVRFVPRSDLTTELLSCSLEELSTRDAINPAATHESTSQDATDPIATHVPPPRGAKI